MRILIGCEESQAVTKAFRDRGFEAYSCDLLPCSGGRPDWHIQGDIFEVIKGGAFPLGNSDFIRDELIVYKWDLAVFHPPCTFLAGSAVQWLSHPEDKNLPFEDRRPHPKYPNRRQDMVDSVEFVKALHDCEIPYLAIENPVGLLSSRFRKPDQIVQPYQFGDEATKTTCLWLKGLPPLTHTHSRKGRKDRFRIRKKSPCMVRQKFWKIKS